MQEFTWPGRTAETELALDREKVALRREFEQRLEECEGVVREHTCGVRCRGSGVGDYNLSRFAPH